MSGYETLLTEASQGVESRVFRWSGRRADAAEGVTSLLDKRPPAWKLLKNADFPPDL